MTLIIGIGLIVGIMGLLLAGLLNTAGWGDKKDGK